MTQPQHPGQPYIPPNSPQSAPGSYNPQPGAPQAPQSFAPSQQFQQPGVPMQAAPAGDSLFSNLTDVSRDFAAKYGKIVVLIAAVTFVLTWFHDAYTAGNVYGANDLSGSLKSGDVGFSALDFFLALIVGAPLAFIKIVLVRLVVEIAANVGARGPQQR